MVGLRSLLYNCSSIAWHVWGIGICQPQKPGCGHNNQRSFVGPSWKWSSTVLKVFCWIIIMCKSQWIHTSVSMGGSVTRQHHVPFFFVFFVWNERASLRKVSHYYWKCSTSKNMKTLKGVFVSIKINIEKLDKLIL